MLEFLLGLPSEFALEFAKAFVLEFLLVSGTVCLSGCGLEYELALSSVCLLASLLVFSLGFGSEYPSEFP